MFSEISVPKNLHNSQENTCAGVLFLLKLQAVGHNINIKLLIRSFIEALFINKIQAFCTIYTPFTHNWKVYQFLMPSANICDTLHDLIPFIQFRKRKKHASTSITFSKVAGFSLQLF